MSRNQVLRWETDRLQIREVEARDLEDLHAVFASNADFLWLRENIAATNAGYDLTALSHYWEHAALDPGRYVLSVCAKQGGPAIGLVDFVDQSPADGMPWIGLVVIHADHQRRGVGSEAVMAVTAHLQLQGHSAVRMAVLEDNEAGKEFARSLGFKDYETSLTPTGGMPRLVVLLELHLAPHVSG